EGEEIAVHTLASGQQTSHTADAVGLDWAPQTTAAPGHDFDDVPADHVFAEDIAWLAESGITRGCNPPDNTHFCPTTTSPADRWRRSCTGRWATADRPLDRGFGSGPAPLHVATNRASASPGRAPARTPPPLGGEEGASPGTWRRRRTKPPLNAASAASMSPVAGRLPDPPAAASR